MEIDEAELAAQGFSPIAIEYIKLAGRNSYRLMVALAYEDDLGVVLRVAVSIEASMKRAIVSEHPGAENGINWKTWSFARREELVGAMSRMPEELRSPLRQFQRMRNFLAHTDREITNEDVEKLIKSMPPGDATIIEAAASNPVGMLGRAHDNRICRQGLRLRAALMALDTRMLAVAYKGFYEEHWSGSKASFVLRKVLTLGDILPAAVPPHRPESRSVQPLDVPDRGDD
jgi:hypothetical protein